MKKQEKKSRTMTKLRTLTMNPYTRDIFYMDNNWYALNSTIGNSIEEFLKLMETRDTKDLDKEEDIEWNFNYLCKTVKLVNTYEEMYNLLLELKDYCIRICKEIDEREED